MSRLGTKLVIVDLTQEEFKKGKQLLFNVSECIGATALRKAFPTTKGVSFGAFSGQVYSKGFRYTYTTFDTDGNPLLIMNLKEPQTIVLKLSKKNENIKGRFNYD